MDLIIVVGSKNPVKVKAVKNAIRGKIENVKVLGVKADSSVSNQPMTDEETKNGARERAKQALKIGSGDVGIGLEGGVFIEAGRVWNTVWCCVINKQGREELVNGLRFMIPEKLEKEILKGKEMGPAMDLLIGSTDIKKKQGAIGVITDGWVSREECYRGLVKIGLGRLFSEEW